MALLRRHLAALRPGVQDGPATRLSPEAAAALLLRLPARLSRREQEVCALTLAGHTREGIGLALGIAPSSVATLRRRAYGKLAIHGAGELFALCLHHTSGPSPAAGDSNLHEGRSSSTASDEVPLASWRPPVSWSVARAKATLRPTRSTLA